MVKILYIYTIIEWEKDRKTERERQKCNKMFHVYCNLPLYNKPILLSLKVIASEIIGSVPTTDYTVIDIRTAVQSRRGAEITTEKDIVNMLIFT